MTSWNAEYRIKVDGVTVTNVTLTGLNINSGRSNIYSQAIAGYCNLNLIETSGNQINFDINDSVTVEVKKSDGSYVYLFGGFITDLSVTISDTGSSGIAQKIGILAVGALARLNRSIFTGNLSHQFDGDRISSLLNNVLFNTWNEVPNSLTWDSYNPSTIWSDAENSGYGDIDTPGQYELHSQTDVNDTIYNLISAAATSGLGYIYEDSQGRIGYADAAHRNTYLATYGYTELDANHAIGPNLQITKKAGDVRNSVTVSYGANSQNSVSASDSVSIGLYGELASKVTTTLRHQTDAQTQADFYLTIRAFPQYEMKQITFPIANPEIDNSDRDALLQVFMGQPINLINLPANMIGGQFQGFVEGWSWSAGLNSLNLTLTVSPLAYSLQAAKWSGVSALETWNTITPSLTWLNATIVN